MTLEKQAIDTLADALKEYYSVYEIEDICGNAGLSVDYRGTNPDFQKLATTLAKNANQENIRTFLNQTCEDLIERVQAKIELAPAEDTIFHQQMETQLQQLQEAFKKVPIAQKEEKPTGSLQFYTMLEVQTFLNKAKGDLIVVDPNIDPRTLGCLIGVKHRIRLMTRNDPNTNLELIGAALEKCRAKGIDIAIRHHETIRDRYMAFNDCCWLADTSLQYAGKTPIILIEIKDSRKLILNDIAQKWNEAIPLT